MVRDELRTDFTHRCADCDRKLWHPPSRCPNVAPPLPQEPAWCDRCWAASSVPPDADDVRAEKPPEETWRNLVHRAQKRLA